MNKLVTIKFSVNRKRDGWDEYPQIVKCEITRDLSYAKKIDLSSDDYDDHAYDRFCDRVPGIVSAITGTECGCDWFFDDGPTVIY